MTTSLNDLLGDRADSDDTVVINAGDADPRRERAAEEPDDLGQPVDLGQPDDVGQPDGDAEGGVDDLFDDDALLAPPRTSRLTLVLVALLILMVGIFVGVQVDRVVRGMPMGPPPAGAPSAAASPGR